MSPTTETGPAAEGAPISGLVPMIHVADMERSVAFYRLIGFEIGNYVPREGPMHWAWLYAPKAADWKRGPNLMLTRSPCPIDASAQEALFYLYAADLTSLRSVVLANGVAAGEIEYPDYLPKGEFRVQDPDGYTLMIAQSTTDTP
jgi:catechol 2,3-dioxygenase-like lactoylglutathione lyase family enzyme